MAPTIIPTSDRLPIKPAVAVVIPHCLVSSNVGRTAPNMMRSTPSRIVMAKQVRTTDLAPEAVPSFTGPELCDMLFLRVCECFGFDDGRAGVADVDAIWRASHER